MRMSGEILWEITKFLSINRSSCMKLFVIIFMIILSILFVYSETINQFATTTFSNVGSQFLSRRSPVWYGNIMSSHRRPRPPAKCLIIMKDSVGALGNHMFLFASSYGLARLHNCKLYVKKSALHYLRRIFVLDMNNTSVELVTDESIVGNESEVYRRHSTCTLFKDLFRVPLIPEFSKYEMVGYYQAYGYFEKYREEISLLFDFHQNVTFRLLPFVAHLLKEVRNASLDLQPYKETNVPYRYLKNVLMNSPISGKPVTWVGIHIRRGDFLTIFKIDTSKSYLVWAIGYYRDKYMNCHFVVGSDDKKYAKENIGNIQGIFISPSDFTYTEDLAALVLCEHMIVTAGTYGWWAAWLAGGDVVHDLNYPVPFLDCTKEHYFPTWFTFPHNSSSKLWQA